jgi:dolichyl-phosphate beta-glucosyltransferase
MRPGLSIVLPAFNEARRLPTYLQRIRCYLADFYGEHYEVIVVDDGSQDDTPAVLLQLTQDWPQFRLLRHARNAGKGAAVRTGMLAAQGDFLLFADADGATPIDEEQQLRQALEQGADIAVGSRWAPGGEVQRRRPWHRRWLGLGFAFLMRSMLRIPVRDTQCGFKMFRRQVGHQLFALCRESGYLFDLEAMVWAQQIGYRVVELPVRWADMPGTKVRLFRDSWNMLHGLRRIRRLAARIRTYQAVSGRFSMPLSLTGPVRLRLPAKPERAGAEWQRRSPLSAMDRD